MEREPRTVTRYCHGPDCLCTREHVDLGSFYLCRYCNRSKLFKVGPVGGR